MGKEGCISQGSRIISFGEGVAKQEGRSLVKNLLGPWNSINDYLGPKPVASLVAELVKNLPAMQETWIRSLGWEDPLEKVMATTPVFLPGEFHGQRSLAGYSPCGHKESNTAE